MDTALQRQPLTVGGLLLLGTIGGSLGVGAMTLAWNGATRITTMELQQKANEERLESAIKAGREQRESIATRSVQMNQQQQAEIDRLRLEQQGAATIAAEMKAQLGFVTQSLARIEQALATRPTAGSR